ANLKQHLASSGQANIGYAVQLRQLAEQVGRALGSRAFESPLTGPLEAAAIRVAVRNAGGSVLQPLAGNRALQAALGSLFRELRHLDDGDPAVGEVASGGSVGAAASETYDACTLLTDAYPDVPAQLRIAAVLASKSQPDTQPAWARAIGAL